MNRTFWNSASLCGLLLALITILALLVNTFIPGLSGVGKVGLSLVKTVATIYILYYYMREYAKTEEYHSYGSAFRFGFTASLCSAVMVGAYSFFHYAFLFPEQVEATLETARKTLEANPQAVSVSLDVIENAFPTITALAQVLWLTLVGLIIAAVLANSTKTKVPPFQTPEAR